MKKMNFLKWPMMCGLGILCILIVSGRIPMYVTWDQSYICVQCLQSESEDRLTILGIPIYRFREPAPPPDDANDPRNFGSSAYRAIFNKPCEHLYIPGGFGRSGHNFLFGNSIACGSTGIMNLMQPRLVAIGGIFQAYRAVGDPFLARESYALVERLIPAHLDMTRLDETSRITSPALQQTWIFGERLAKTKAADQWRMLNADLATTISAKPGSTFFKQVQTKE